MDVRWSPRAADDFTHIVEYLRERNPVAALRIARRIYQSIAALSANPKRGRAGRVDNTRELVLAPLPYVAIYRVHGDFVEVARILHGAQRWP